MAWIHDSDGGTQYPEGTGEGPDAFYLLGCVMLWRASRNFKARWELVRAVNSPDPRFRRLAACLLAGEATGIDHAVYSIYSEPKASDSTSEAPAHPEVVNSSSS